MQEILVYIIGGIVLLTLIFKIYGFFFSKNQQKGGCGCGDCHCNHTKKHEK